MTHTEFNFPACNGDTSETVMGRLALPLAVFAGTIATTLFVANGAEVCYACTLTPVQDALPFAAGAALLVIGLQTFRKMRNAAEV